MSDKSKRKVLMKLILIGDSGVGKSSLMNQFIENKFTGDYKATIGVDFLKKEVVIGGVSVSLEIWDTGLFFILIIYHIISIQILNININ